MLPNEKVPDSGWCTLRQTWVHGLGRMCVFTVMLVHHAKTMNFFAEEAKFPLHSYMPHLLRYAKSTYGSCSNN